MYDLCVAIKTFDSLATWGYPKHFHIGAGSRHVMNVRSFQGCHRIVTVVMGPLENEHVETQPGLVQMIFLFSIGRFLDEPAVNFQGNNYKKLDQGVTSKTISPHIDTFILSYLKFTSTRCRRKHVWRYYTALHWAFSATDFTPKKASP